jgi:hypothetical protein
MRSYGKGCARLLKLLPMSRDRIYFVGLCFAMITSCNTPSLAQLTGPLDPPGQHDTSQPGQPKPKTPHSASTAKHSNSGKLTDPGASNDHNDIANNGRYMPNLSTGVQGGLKFGF